MTIKAVLWDMDGTLIDSEPTALAALSLAMNDMGISADENFLQRFVGMAADEIYTLLKAKKGLQVDPTRWETMKHEHYLNGISSVKPFSTALEIWNLLEKRGLQQAIVTNSDRIITDANLRHIGLAIPNLTTVTRNDVTMGKPNPEPYLRAATLLGRSPSECIVIEDSASGLKSAMAANMPVFIVPHSMSFGPSAERMMQEMSDVLKLI